MGNSESAPPAPEFGHSIDDFDGVETLGYRVLGVQPNSPASASGLVSFFDFILGADGEMLLGSGEGLQEGEEYDDVDFPALLEKFKGRTLQLLVWNIKCQEQRLVDIVPSDDWEGAGLLGVTIRLDDYAGAEDRLIRILAVEHNSPAAIAGLVSSQDYLLGTTTHSFDSTKVLAAVLEAHVDRVVELYVYNTNSDKVRVVALMPTWSWGGNGLLGAEVGTGYLHRLPGSCRNTLGGSVERRVRWIGGNKNGPMASSSPQQLQQAAALELEPQLEMEPNHEEEEEDGEEEQSMGSVSLASQISATPEAPTRAASAPAPATATTTDNRAYQREQQTPPSYSQAQDFAGRNNYSSEGPASSSNDVPQQAAETLAATPATPRSQVGRSLSPTRPPAAAPLPRPQAGRSLSPQPMTNRTSSQSSQSSYQHPAPAPYPMLTTPYNMSPPPNSVAAAAAAKPLPTVTMFIPAAKPPPEGQNISAKDLFSGPPPVAKIPSRTTVILTNPADNQFRTPHKTVSSNGSSSVPNSASSPEFLTPHPPAAANRSPYETTPPVGTAAPASGNSNGAGVNNNIKDMLPPPPKMSGAR